jgi:integrase
MGAEVVGVYLRGGRYWYKRMIEGQVYQRPLRVKKGEESRLSARLAQVEDEILGAHFGTPAPRPGSMLFSEFERVYLERKASNKSADRDRQRLPKIRAILKDLPLRAYGPDHFQRLESRLLAESLSPTTINRYFQLLRAFFSLAVEERRLAENPLRAWRFYVEDKRARALTMEEIRLILAGLKHLRAQPKGPVQAILYDVIALGLVTGMRLSEVIGMR